MMSNDYEEVRATLETYLKGHATGDASYMRQAFLSRAHIEGFREGTFFSWSLDEYCTLFSGRPADDESSRKRSINLIDRVGRSAIAKATLIHGAIVFTDYFVLLETEDGWKIANKVFYGQAT
jgi:hypothetical protein